MIFTVFQYVSVLEEDAQNHSTELAKKGSENDTSSNDGDESDGDSNDAIYHSLNFYFKELNSKTCSYPSNKDSYFSFFRKITIPPPKV